MSVKVADFGISCVESECGTAKGFASTYRWMAPEMIKEKSHTKKVDVYSFGVVLWELLTGLVPFNGLTPEQAAFAVAQKVYVWFSSCFYNTLYISCQILKFSLKISECKATYADILSNCNKPPHQPMLGQ